MSRKILKFSSIAIGIIVMSLLLFAAGLFWRITYAPLKLDGKITHSIIRLGLGAKELRYDGGRLEWRSEEKALSFSFATMKIDYRDRLQAEFEKLTLITFWKKDKSNNPFSISMDAKAAKFILMENSHLPASPSKSKQSERKNISAYIQSFLIASEKVIKQETDWLHNIHKIDIPAMEIIILDKETGERWKSEDALISFEKNNNAIHAKLWVGWIDKEGEREHIALDVRRNEGEAGLISGKITALRPDMLAGIFSKQTFFTSVEVPLSGNFIIELNEEGNFSLANFEIQASHPGPARLLARRPMKLESFSMKGQIDFTQNSISMEKFDFVLGENKAQLYGIIDYEVLPNGLLSKLFVYASGKEAVLDLTNLFSFHLAPDNIGLDAEIDLVEQYILLSRLQMEMGEKEKGKLFLKGKLGLTAPPIIEMEGQLSSIPLSMAKSLWPEALTPRVRAWVVKNVNGGEISGGTVKLDIQKNDWENIHNKQALRPEMIQLAFTLSDTNIQYLPTLPPLQKLRGNALLSATTFDAWVAQATVYPDEESQGVSISSGRFSVDKFRGANANVDTNIIGAGEDILTFISKKPLSLLKRFPISPKNVQGRVEGKINIRFPIKKAMKLSDVQVNVSAESKALRINNIFPGKSLSDGQITLQADRKALSVQGVGALEGIVSRFQWQENFTSPSGQGSKIRIIGAFNGNDLARLGLNIAKGRIRDKAEMDITLEGGLGIWRRGEASINLTGVEFFAYPFSWMKPPHEQAQLKAELSFFNQKKKLKTIELQIIGEKANLNGKIEFLEDGRIETMKFDPFELGEKNSGIIEISTRQNIVYTTLNARHFDASYFLKLKKPEEFRGGKFNINAYLGDNVEYDFTIENLHANNNVSAINVSGKASYVKKRYEIAGISAYVEEDNKRDSILLSLIRKTPELRELTITSPNASHILRAMDIIPSMRGGDLTINVALGEEASSGEMLIENFAVRDVPFFGKLLALGSLTAMADALYRDGMEFRVAKMQFENNPKQANLTRFYAYGTGVGVTLKGKINWQEKTLAMNGDIIPAYTLNSIFSSIPILGPLLIGDKGLLGISYKINGNLSAPELNVNPLSLLAPGRFRQIFEVFSTRPVPQKGHGFRKNRRMIPKKLEQKEGANP